MSLFYFVAFVHVFSVFWSRSINAEISDESASFNINNTILQSGRIRTYGNGFYLTPDEEAALDKFRPMVVHLDYEPWMFSDNVLIKFLRAKNLDLSSAEDMVKKTLQWRKSRNLVQLLKDDYTIWEKLFPFIISGQDKEQRSIFYIMLSAYDVRKAVIGGHYNTLENLYDRSYEKAVQVVRGVYESSGQNVGLEGILIIDAAGFNLRQHACARCLGIFVHIIQAYETYYPQTLNKIFLINAPRTVEIVLQVMRPFMSSHTRKALQVYGVDKNEWLPILKDHIEPDQLLEGYGGTRKLNSDTSTTMG